MLTSSIELPLGIALAFLIALGFSGWGTAIMYYKFNIYEGILIVSTAGVTVSACAMLYGWWQEEFPRDDWARAGITLALNLVTVLVLTWFAPTDGARRLSVFWFGVGNGLACLAYLYLFGHIFWAVPVALALSNILIVALGVHFLGEEVSTVQRIGVVVIAIGVFLIAQKTPTKMAGDKHAWTPRDATEKLIGTRWPIENVSVK